MGETARCIVTRTVVEKQCLPPGVPCYICGKDYIAVRCAECGSFHFYCERCATELHVKCFYHHCPEVWKVLYSVMTDLKNWFAVIHLL